MANLTTEQIGKVQFAEALIYIDYGVTASQTLLGATRGGAEFVANMSVRDVEFDGSCGKTRGMQWIEGQDAMIRCSLISLSQSNIKEILPGYRETGTGTATVIKNPTCGPIASASYHANVTIFGKTLDGSYKKCMIKLAMAENGLAIKMSPKSEAEQAIEFSAHYDATGNADTNGDLWEIADVSSVGTSGTGGG